MMHMFATAAATARRTPLRSNAPVASLRVAFRLAG